jgi:UDP-glucose 4-epimerase
VPPAPRQTGIYNLFYPEPITILELAHLIKDAIATHTHGKTIPQIEIVDKGLPTLFSPNEKETLDVDIEETMEFFEIPQLKSPKQTIHEIVKTRTRHS